MWARRPDPVAATYRRDALPRRRRRPGICGRVATAPSPRRIAATYIRDAATAAASTRPRDASPSPPRHRREIVFRAAAARIVQVEEVVFFAFLLRVVARDALRHRRGPFIGRPPDVREALLGPAERREILAGREFFRTLLPLREDGFAHVDHAAAAVLKVAEAFVAVERLGGRRRHRVRCFCGDVYEREACAAMRASIFVRSARVRLPSEYPRCARARSVAFGISTLRPAAVQRPAREDCGPTKARPLSAAACAACQIWGQLLGAARRASLGRALDERWLRVAFRALRPRRALWAPHLQTPGCGLVLFFLIFFLASRRRCVGAGKGEREKSGQIGSQRD